MQVVLINQAKRDAQLRAKRVICCGARAAWVKLTIWVGVGLLTAAASAAQLAGTLNPTSIEFEEALSKMPPDSQESDRRIAIERQERFRMRVAIPDAVGDDVAVANVADQAAGLNSTLDTPKSLVARSGVFRWIILVVALLLLAGMLVRRKLVLDLLGSLNQQLNLVEQAPARPASSNAKIRAEEEGVTAFFTAFQAGPPTAPQRTAVGAPSPHWSKSGRSDQHAFPAEPGAVKEFQARAGKLLLTQRSLLQEINRTSDGAGRHKMLAALRWEMHILKAEAGLPWQLPVWQVASALEGLLKQLTDNVGNITSSALRTVAGGVELLNALCQSGVDLSSLTVPPLKLLVVDSSSISRNAISRALKRAFNPPDLVEDAEAALALVTTQSYDVIFLAALMPAADGFNFCSSIRGTVPNRTTPLVFVTDQSDFDARVQSTLSREGDLIGKPFLTFEITLKALTLALRSRLQASVSAAAVRCDADKSELQSPATANPRSDVADESPLPDPFINSAAVSQALAELPLLKAESSTLLREPMTDESAAALLTCTSARLGPVRDLFEGVFQTVDEAARQGILAEVYLRIHSLIAQQALAADHPALPMSTALEGLLRKLLENPQNATTSTLITVAAGLEMLFDLCGSGVRSDLAINPPIRILVVDDDPVARRAVTCALQLAFEKPENTGSGSVALMLAAKKPFDVIFLDVQMPGMDGITVCSKIRATVLNHATPVVFVTSQGDFTERTRMSRGGGNDFVAKPFLTSEIMVKALTFVLRGRLEKTEPVMTCGRQ